MDFTKLSNDIGQIDALTLVVVSYTSPTENFSDLLLVQDEEVKEAWDFTNGEVPAETMSQTHPDFKFKGLGVAKFIKETFICPAHPGITNIVVEIGGVTIAELSV